MFGNQVDSLALTYTYNNAIRGSTYRTRYRVRNVNGWSAYSPIGYLLAASVPGTPLAPKYSSATATQISILITSLIDNGGAPVINYQLWIDDGLQGAFVQV